MPKVPVTRIALLLDSSISMGTIRHQALNAFNCINENIKANALAGQKVIVSLWTFDVKVNEKFLDQDASVLRHVKDHEYRLGSATCLYDAIIRGTQHLHSTADVTNDNEARLVICITDGQNNNSFNSLETVQRVIAQEQAKGNCTFVFQVPPRTKREFVQAYNVPEGNVREWEATDAGTQEMGESTSSGLTTYFGARAKGIRSVETFFVTADLSKVSEEDVKSMPDLSSKFRAMAVEKEVEVREFIENKLGAGSYVIGSAYYQLMKKETVQANKLILVRRRGEKRVYGGKDGRRLLGLPHGAPAKVDVGNLSDFEVFVQSTSVNRKLVRGTTLLLDVSQKSNLKPTWDHTVVDQAKAQAKAEAAQAMPASVISPPAAVALSPRRTRNTRQQLSSIQSSAKALVRDSRGRFASKS